MPGKWATALNWLTSLQRLSKKELKRPPASYQKEEFAPRIGSYNIILNGQDVPVCVTRLVSMRLVRFCDVTAEFARKEGEGDLSLEYWQREHQRFFTCEGYFSDDMELIMEEFEVVDVL